MSININLKPKTAARIHRCYIRPQGVDCDCKDAYACEKCGWNYDIEKKRKDKLGVNKSLEVRNAS